MRAEKNGQVIRVGTVGLIAASLIPYVAVLAGLYWLESAWVSMLAYHAGMVAVLAIAGQWSRAPDLVRGWRGSAFVRLVPVYLSAGVLIYFLWPHVKLDDIALVDALGATGLRGAGFWGFVICYCLLNPPLEELFWRGFLGDEARGLIWADVVFGGYHGLVMALFVTGTWAVISVVLLVGAAWVWRTMARSWDGLAMPLFTHLIADVGVMSAVSLLL